MNYRPNKDDVTEIYDHISNYYSLNNEKFACGDFMIALISFTKALAMGAGATNEQFRRDVNKILDDSQTIQDDKEIVFYI